MAAAGTDAVAELVTSSLQGLVGNLTGQAGDLRTLVSLLGHSPVSFLEIERHVAGMEGDVERVEQFLERERVAVAELERLCVAATKQIELADELATAGEALGVPRVTRAGTASVAQAQAQAAPPPLPPRASSGKPPALGRSQSQPAGGGCGSGTSRAAPKPRAMGSRARAGSRSPMAKSRARGRRTSEQPRPRSAGSASGEDAGGMPAPSTPRGKRVPSLTPLGSEELASVPQYQRGRLTLDKLTAAVTDINEVLANKYQLMAKPLSKLWGPELAQFQEYKQQATKEVKGCPFFCASDVKSLKSMKGSTGTSVLQVLRHVKRLRVLSGGGHTRYVLLQ